MSRPTPRSHHVGRPRRFAPQKALAVALDVFWLKGFGATSLDELTAAMGLSRSSFYACFGSKHAVFMSTINAYAEEHFAKLRAVADAEPDAKTAVRAMLAVIADPYGGRRGCFFVNAVCELGASDEAFCELANTHLARERALMTQTVQRAGCAESIATERASAMLAIAIGATSLRKAGVPAAHIVKLLAQADLLFPI